MTRNVENVQSYLSISLFDHSFTISRINIKFYSKTLKTCANNDRYWDDIITNNMYLFLYSYHRRLHQRSVYRGKNCNGMN